MLTCGPSKSSISGQLPLDYTPFAPSLLGPERYRCLTSYLGTVFNEGKKEG